MARAEGDAGVVEFGFTVGVTSVVAVAAAVVLAAIVLPGFVGVTVFEVLSPPPQAALLVSNPIAATAIGKLRMFIATP